MNNPEQETKLYAKLAEVVAEIGYVSKDGRNEFHKYNYTSAEALLATVRGPLAERRVVLMPSLTALSEREYTTSQGKGSVITTAHVRFTFVDGDTGETHQCEWAGQGDDPADKGLGKAYTNAIKTFLREQFLIPQGDDPEADPHADTRGADRAAPQPVAGQPSQSDRPATAKQQDMLRTAALKAGLSPAQFANMLLAATEQEERVWSGDEAAQRWVDRALDRFPARYVTAALVAVEQAGKRS